MNKKLLLVDDTETVRLFMKMMLKSLSYTIYEAKDGKEAVEKAASIKPDLILMDIMMPIMDGIEACTKIKSDNALKDIPVVMVTTKGAPEIVEKAFVAGCNDYLTKPIDKLELLGKVKTFLNDR